MFLYLVILLLTIKWWVNVSNCLSIFLFVVLNFRIGTKISSMKNIQELSFLKEQVEGDESDKVDKYRSKVRKLVYKNIRDEDAISVHEDFEEKVRRSVSQLRFNSWMV